MDDRFKKWRPELMLDARTSTFGTEAARIGGLRLGIEYMRVHRVGYGIYGVSDQVSSEQFASLGEDVDSARFNLGYVSIFYERVLLLHPKWEWSSALHWGLGQVNIDYRISGESAFRSRNPITVRPVEVSSSGYYHLTWWASVGGGVGYRFMRNSPAEVRSAYQGWLYIVKLKIRFGRLVRRIWDKSVTDEY